MAKHLVFCGYVAAVFFAFMAPTYSQPQLAPQEQTANQEASSSSLITNVRKGDTLIDILNEAGIPANQSYNAIAELKNIFNPAKLKRGQKVKIYFDLDGSGESQKVNLSSFSIYLEGHREAQVTYFGDDLFLAKMLSQNRELKTHKAEFTIKNTLYTSAEAANVPVPTIMELIKIFSYDIDFQREIRNGQTIKLLYEQFYDDYGQRAGMGNIIYASFETKKGDPFEAFYFQTTNGFAEYFSASGESLRKGLLRTPVDGARITSGYGKRIHPILGYTKMHKGLDFGAPTGTPIYAAGDGVVLSRKYFGSYGNYIKLRHNNGYETVYAHLHGFARSIRRGSKVKQGQIIGYVGSTGRSTGPHLHYEIIVNGKHINPLSVKSVAGKKLSGPSLAIFKQYKQQVEELYNNAI